MINCLTTGPFLAVRNPVLFFFIVLSLFCGERREVGGVEGREARHGEGGNQLFCLRERACSLQVILHCSNSFHGLVILHLLPRGVTERRAVGVE